MKVQRARTVAVASRPSFFIRLPRVLAPIVLWPAIGLLLVYAVCYVQFALQLASFPFDVDQGEGYDAWSAWLINLGQLPYASNAAYPYYSSLAYCEAKVGNVEEAKRLTSLAQQYARDPKERSRAGDVLNQLNAISQPRAQ